MDTVHLKRFISVVLAYRVFKLGSALKTRY